MRHGGRASRGQAIVGLVLAVAVAGMAWEGLALAGRTSWARLQLQNGLDAGATTGGAVLADGINTVAALNSALLALGIAALLGQGEAAVAVRKVQQLQDQVIRLTPVLAQAEACAVAMSSGAAVAIIRGRNGEKWPSLMLRRTYFFPGLFGQSFPLWIADDLRQSGGRRWGDRVVFLDGGTLSGRGIVRTPLAGTAGGGVAGGGRRASSLPLLWPGYKSRLIPASGKAGDAS